MAKGQLAERADVDRSAAGGVLEWEGMRDGDTIRVGGDLLPGYLMIPVTCYRRQEWTECHLPLCQSSAATACRLVPILTVVRPASYTGFVSSTSTHLNLPTPPSFLF
ncbi:unnamed protein product [Nezara viridula]|uniref:Uncharacterized protein n=1 Tax=Nezara viridula TaxID=85310 RepID=A0A9P0HB83_NEZVI|nr:unnamed protein product [Nezara viridula]